MNEHYWRAWFDSVNGELRCESTPVRKMTVERVYVERCQASNWSTYIRRQEASFSREEAIDKLRGECAEEMARLTDAIKLLQLKIAECDKEVKP